MNIALILVLLAGIVAFTYGASIGFRGKALHLDYYGHGVSDRVKTDSRLRAEANNAFKVWCTVAAVLLAVPVVWIFSDLTRARSTWELLGLAVYVLPVVVVGAYPLEKVKDF